MMELPPSASFPLVFFDGDCDVDVGSVTVTASLDFKKFQALIAQKISVSPHQISISLVRRKKARSSPEIRRKVPIDESSDFAAIARERDCFVLAVMRRSRSGRRGRGRRGRHGAPAGGVDDEKKAAAEAIQVVPELTILKRSHHQEERVAPMGSIGFWDYEAQLRNLQRMRERYLMSTSSPYYAYAQPQAVPVAGVYVSPPSTPAACEECVDAKRNGRSPGFHWCVYDKITIGFRSPVGPIERPAKKNVEASVA